MLAPCGAGAPSPFPPFRPCPFTSSSFVFFYFSLSFIGFTYFLLLSILSLCTRIVPLRFQAGGRRKRPNLGLVCCVCVICIPWLRWILVFCSIWFSLVLCVHSVLWHYWLGHLTRKNPSPIWPIIYSIKSAFSCVICIEQGLFHKFAFDNKVLKTFVKFWI